MLDFWAHLFDSSGFMPHGHCYFWQPAILWTHVVGDILTVTAYFTIPLGLLYFARKRSEINVRGILWLFGAFILACGATHLIDIITVWDPAYRIAGLMKLITGVISMTTAVFLWVLMPQALKVPTIKAWEMTNEHLRQKVDELQAAQEELQMFTYTMSHNLRAPLRHLIAFSGMLEDSQSEHGWTDEQRSHLANIHRASGKMGTLLDELIGYMQLGQNELSLQEVPLTPIIADIISSLETGDSRPIAWKVDQLPAAPGDPRAIRSMWYNLFENAVKFTGYEERPQISLQYVDRDDFHRFILTDNCVGFTEAFSEKMFEPFERLHKERDFSGTGIGLSEVARIIQRHHAYIEAFGSPGRGATMQIDWPKQLPAPPEPSPTQPV